MNFRIIKAIFLAVALLYVCIIQAQPTDFSKAGILASAQIKSPVRETIIQLLQEEIAKRTSIKLPNVNTADKQSIIALALVDDVNLSGLEVPKRLGENLPENKPEGFRIAVTKQAGKQVIWLIGADQRGDVPDFHRQAGRLETGAQRALLG